MKHCFLLLFVCFSATLIAQPYAGHEKVVVKTHAVKAAQCTPPTTTTYLELNNVRAMVHTAGNLWQVPNQNYTQYEIPKNSGIMALFTAALWLGGTDVNNQLKLAALRYRQGQDYWTGPLSQVFAETSYENCAKYDRHFVTTQDMIREFNAWYEAGVQDAENGTNTQSELFPDYKVPEIIQNWPAHGDVTQGQAYYLAPFFDYNEDGEYDWQDGDYPWYDIKRTKECKIDREISLYGDVNFWWVMNDKGNIHTESGGDPIGMEIRAQAFAFASNDEVNNMTFYNYELINRGTQTLYNTYFGFFTDGALGNPFDDYVGCDVNRGLGYYYNGDNYDEENSGFRGYGSSPPAVGVDFFEGPYQDNDGEDNAFGIGVNEALNGIGYGDGVIDNERFGMRRFLYYSNTTNGANPNQTDPITASDFYNYLRGRWKDGSPFYYGGSGHISDSEANPDMPCDFMFPGDTDPLGWGTGGNPQAPWTEVTANNPPNDKRFVQSAGPFILMPGAVNNITVGVCWARSNGGDPFESVSYLQRADDKAQALFENCFKVLEGPHAPDLHIQELKNELILTISNPVNSNNYGEAYEEFDPFIVASDPNADKNYRFQGYQIFQLKAKQYSLSDIGDPDKARLVAQCDVKDDVARIINFEFDDDLQASVPVERVDGENKGIRHSFQVKTDLFAQGTTQLVNFKRYYYIAVAYAHNNYKTYNPDDPDALDGQKKRYLASRKAAMGEVKSVEAIPHDPMPEADGTLHFLEYGQSPLITRLDGYGNGNRALELTNTSVDYILTNGKMEQPTYDRGGGPIGVKVIDPLNVADGYFQLRFRDYEASVSNGADTASWVIYRYASEGGQLLDSVRSEMTLPANNEQLIPQWGISVQIHQENYFGPAGNAASKVTDMISSTITFADSSKQWLDFVNDNDAFFPTNWIRSGIYAPETDPSNSAYECTPDAAGYLDPCSYRDEVGVDDDKQFATILGGGIAPHRLTGYQSDYMPMAYYDLSSPGSSRANASISFLPSIDLVITSDRSKWTRCPVIETGRDAALNVGGCEPGAMRKSPSVNKYGQPDGTGTGMGWFPGYAIDLETGARLYMAFGENSFSGADNGANMLWDPSDRLVNDLGIPVMGGVQPIYIFTCDQATVNNFVSGFDFPAYIPTQAEGTGNVLYQKMLEVEAGSTTAKRQVYGSLSWVANPLLKKDQKHLSTDVMIKLRVNKEYKNYVCSGMNQGKPMYGWNMQTDRTIIGSESALADVLKLINVVPNPYNAFSEYENNKLDNRVKITNLPERCTITIYSTNGKLIKQIKKDSPVTYQDWTLTNQANIPVSSGIYLIHVQIPGVGERILKSFISMRMVDLQNL
jgi:hypothetical protein